MDAITEDAPRRPFTIKLWPPSQNTRIVLVDRMTKNLSSRTVFTEKYGSLGAEEAAANAKEIEASAFSTADEHYDKKPDGDGSSAVQFYAQECSKLVLEVLKKGSVAKGKEVLKSNNVTFFDISKGQRTFIDSEEARELLKPLKEAGNSYTKICFSNRSFGLDAAYVAEPILTSLKDQLKEVDLSDIVAGRQEAEALDVMNIFSKALEGCTLKSLNLSNNALGEKGVRAFGSLLRSQGCLEELYLMNDGISEEAAKAVCELIPSTEKLRVLHFHNNMTGDEGAVAIAEVVKRSPLLQDLRCSSTRVGCDGGKLLSEALAMCVQMKKLDLRDNMFGVEAGIVLSKSLSKYGNLKELYLSYLNLEDQGAISIANVLKETVFSLEILEMAGNDITAESASSLAACIAANQRLTKLNLAENELKDDGVIPISKALEEGHVELREVDLSSNSLRRVGARVLAQSVVHKPQFKLLTIDGNFISDEGIDELKEIFKRYPDMLGSLDENDPDGEDDHDDVDKESVDEDEGSEDGLESKLKNLDVSEEM